MNEEDILAVLEGRKGTQNLDRGVGPEDVLLGEYRDFNADQLAAFWPVFGKLVQRILDQANGAALEGACLFVVSLFHEAPEVEPTARESFAWLLNEQRWLLDPPAGDTDGRGRQVLLLRALVALGLGDETWWRRRFQSWREKLLQPGLRDDFDLWQGVFHTSRGWLKVGQGPDIWDWLAATEGARELPALELYGFLTDKLRVAGKPFWGTFWKDLHWLFARPSDPYGAQLQKLEPLRNLLKAWLVDCASFSPEKAEEKLRHLGPAKCSSEDVCPDGMLRKPWQIATGYAEEVRR